MATHQEVTAVANDLLTILKDDVLANVPGIMGFQQRALAALPALAGQLAEKACETLDNYRLLQTLKAQQAAAVAASAPAAQGGANPVYQGPKT